MAKQHNKQFKLDAAQYYFDRKELGVRGCTKSWCRLQRSDKMVEGLPGVWRSRFVAPVITLLMGRRSLHV